MTEFDLKKFKTTYERDSAEDIKSIADRKQLKRLTEGVHEVVVTGIHKKEGETGIRLTEREGGTVEFSMTVSNAQQAETLIFLAIPIAKTFRQVTASDDKKISFIYEKTVKTLSAMGINTNDLREALIESNGEAAEILVGSQFLVTASWPSNKLHLDYDSESKQYFFVTSMNERFAEGELAVPIVLDPKIDIRTRYSEAVAIADQAGYKFATQLDIAVSPHPTAYNDTINEKLSALSTPKKSIEVSKSFIPVNKTKPVFASVVPKKIGLPL